MYVVANLSLFNLKKKYGINYVKPKPTPPPLTIKIF